MNENDEEKVNYLALLRQQTILAKFGELALKSDNLDEILTQACRLVGEALGTDLAKIVEREGAPTWPVETQLEVYLQALLIFFGKLTIYLKALDKPLPKEFRDYIG